MNYLMLDTIFIMRLKVCSQSISILPVLSSGVVRYLPSNLRRKKIRGIWDRDCDRNCEGEIPDFSKKSGI